MSKENRLTDAKNATLKTHTPESKRHKSIAEFMNRDRSIVTEFLIVFTKKRGDKEGRQKFCHTDTKYINFVTPRQIIFSKAIVQKQSPISTQSSLQLSVLTRTWGRCIRLLKTSMVLMDFSTIGTIYGMRRKYIESPFQRVIQLWQGERYLTDGRSAWMALRKIWTCNTTATIYRTAQ